MGQGGRIWLAVPLVLMAACAGPQRPPSRAAAAAPAQPPPTTAAPRASGQVKIGKPYQVFGVWYYPADDRNYDEQGLASWYGPGFHALDTANGERYDQDSLTAAHKTLPMPSYVEVENLDNGRRLTVRVNDRGPFVAGRIIDLSRRSAQLLGVDRPGTARVRVRRVFPDGAMQVALQPQAPPPQAPPVEVAAAPVVPAVVVTPPPPPDAEPAPVRSVAIPGGATSPAVLPRAGQSFVQVAALGDPGRIAWLTGYLGAFGPVVTEKTPTGLTRVRLGPYNDVDSAGQALSKVRAAGYTDARLVTIAAP
ncbi:hypothetical protein IP88_11275 [alpha proteobacterium AAP81b]|nr:hypothetical protein IP88_11275 [alpha proteobacterium AAP81b]